MPKRYGDGAKISILFSALAPGFQAPFVAARLDVITRAVTLIRRDHVSVPEPHKIDGNRGKP